jgi:DNA-binding transcriptional ArsR family regulator
MPRAHRTFAYIEMVVPGNEGRADIRTASVRRSAGDATRPQVLRLLAQRPCSTHEIADLIGLTEAAISKHLEVAPDGGLDVVRM